MSASLKPFGRFAHEGVKAELLRVASAFPAAQIGSSADGEITIHLLSNTVYVRRYKRGAKNWRIATTGNKKLEYPDQESEVIGLAKKWLS